MKDKVLNIQQQLSSQTANPVVSSRPNITTKIGTRQITINSSPPTGSFHHTPAQGDGNVEMVLAKGQQVAPPSHAERPDSTPDDTPHMTKKEMSRLFKWQNQQEDNGQVTVTQRPQQVEDSLVKEQRRQELARRADEAVLEVERVKKQPPRRTMLPHTSSKQEPVNQRQPKKKVKQQQAAADDSDSDILEYILYKKPQQQQQPAHHKPPVDISEQERIEEERERQTEEEVSKSEQETDKILQELERTRKVAPLRLPSISSAPGSPKPPCIKSQASLDDELEESGENLDDDDDRPYDPNLVCPKCGKQYRVGEIQKIKQHILRCTNN